MFNFFHPRPVVDGRAVAVKVVKQTAAARQDTHTLVVPARTTAAGRPASNEEGAADAAA